MEVVSGSSKSVSGKVARATSPRLTFTYLVTLQYLPQPCLDLVVPTLTLTLTPTLTLTLTLALNPNPCLPQPRLGLVVLVDTRVVLHVLRALRKHER